MITKEILEGSLKGNIAPVKVTVGYRIAMLLVAVGMILLPIIYLGIIVLAGYGVFLLAHDPGNILTNNRSPWVILFLYIGPLVIGTALLFFMVKPLITKREKHAMGIEVTRREEPLLFQFIELICKAINAPVPKKVMLYCEPNASASFKNGVFSFLRNNLQLTVGLPLAETMTVTQLGGIIAHELGHFSQGAGMRITYVIRSLNNWFFRLVFERDKWDERIERWSGNSHFALAIILYLARFAIWLTRKILYGLMFLGNMMSSIMLRQMEFDADRHEIRFSGTKTFISTTKTLDKLSVHWSIMYNNIFENWSNKKLVNNIPSYIALKMEQNNNRIAEDIKKNINEQKTTLFDTHPSNKDRIKNAKKENTVGVFRINKPATSLFKNFEQRSVVATTNFYMKLMGQDFNNEYLVDSESFIEYDNFLEENNRALIDFYGEAISVHFPINFKIDDHIYSPKKSRDILEKISSHLGKYKNENLDLIEQKYDLFDKESGWQAAQMLLKLGFKIKPAEFDLPKSNANEVQKKLDNAAKRRKELNAKYKGVNKYIRPLPALLQNIPIFSPAEKKKILEFARIENKLSDQYPHFRKLLSKFNKLAILIANRSLLERDKDAMEYFQKLESSLVGDLKSMYHDFEDTPYPFVDDSQTTISDFLFPDGLKSMNTEKIFNVMQTMTNLYPLVYCRIIGEIGTLSLKVIEHQKKSTDTVN